MKRTITSSSACFDKEVTIPDEKFIHEIQHHWTQLVLTDKRLCHIRRGNSSELHLETGFEARFCKKVMKVLSHARSLVMTKTGLLALQFRVLLNRPSLKS